jgi:hypothetical protein
MVNVKTNKFKKIERKLISQKADREENCESDAKNKKKRQR